MIFDKAENAKSRETLRQQIEATEAAIANSGTIDALTSKRDWLQERLAELEPPDEHD
jgi:hypothetical protein